MAGLCLIAWLVLIGWPGGQPPLAVVVAVICVFSVGGPASGIGFMLARDYNPRHRISTATGLINVGGFCGAVVMVFAVGQILDAVEPGAATHSAQAYRWAFGAIALLTAIGIVRMVTWILRTRAQVLRAAARGEDVPVEIVPHRWDRLDTGEFSIVMTGRTRSGEPRVQFKEVHRLPADPHRPAPADRAAAPGEK